MNEELKNNPKAYFITLTINDDNMKKLIKECKSKEENDIATYALRMCLERIRKTYGKSVKHWHSSAPNKTQEDRKAIPFTISKSFMKQLLDYPRAIGYDKMDLFSSEMQQLLGYHSRVPASLDEWYQPEENRFYKKNQD